jgi:capsular exopolysaccharide synthesis family protein
VSSLFEVPAQSPWDLHEYLRILRRRAWVIVLVTVLAVAAAYVWARNQEQVYTAVGQIVVAQTTEKGVVATQNQVVQSDAVHRAALGHLPNAPRVTATFDGESGSVTLRAESTDPALAAKSIDAHIQAYRDYLTYIAGARLGAVNNQIKDLQQQIDQLNARARQQGAPPPAITSQITSLSAQMKALRDRLPELRLAIALAGPNVEVLLAGSPPTKSGAVTDTHAVLIGLGIGLLLGVLVALLLELLDDSIRTQQDLVRVAGAAVPVLGTIPPARSRDGTVVVLEQPASPAAEAYRSLRTTVLFAVGDRTRCIAITTARTRDGKTETAANLAVSTAQLGERTVIVDCDMRYPRVHEFFGIPNDAGLTSLVSGDHHVGSLKPTDGKDPLFVLPAGPVPPKPAELLGSSRSHDVLAKLVADDTLVIVDTPPLLLATDTVALAPALGGILLVATARVTRKNELRKALELLRQVDAPLLGLVLQSAATAETGGFGEERSRRERRRVERWRKLHGAAVEPATIDVMSVEPDGATPPEPVRAITWSAASGRSPNGAEHTVAEGEPPTGTTADE